ncbi:hypothetical protein [Cryobacterium zongtaii]|uniref:hypothetical protein n=1 Tax=Cryobacterium zongtaii TaxID=1259217 RepID=UPI001057588F|nr:hypothetical protein [Cryobacterium zongtaii]
MIRLQHKIRWIAYILVGMLVVRALFDLFNGEIGRGVGIFIAAAVILGCQRLLERDARNEPSDGHDTVA